MLKFLTENKNSKHEFQTNITKLKQLIYIQKKTKKNILLVIKICTFTVSLYESSAIFLPREATTRPEQVHKGDTDETIYVEDQIGFLRMRARDQFMSVFGQCNRKRGKSSARLPRGVMVSHPSPNKTFTQILCFGMEESPKFYFTLASSASKVPWRW